MKKYEFELEPYTRDVLFPHHLIKSKKEILELLMEATRYMLIKAPMDAKQAKGRAEKIVLLIDKMSRLFICSDNKAYSIVFPFAVINQENNELRFEFQKDGVEISVDHQLISHFISVLKSESFYSNCSLDFADPIDRMEDDFNKNFWVFTRYLLLMEDGYVRYDIDEKSYRNALAQGNPHTHPLHHIDIFYTSNVACKFGLESPMDNECFIDCINVKTNCKYLKTR